MSGGGIDGTGAGTGTGSLSRRRPKHVARTAPDARGGVSTSAMIASLDAEGRDTVAAPFGHALVELARERDDVVALTADLAKYTDLHVFAEACPDRFYQMGMAEQLMVSAAAGLAREGFVPFATTYAVFASRRAYDFVCMAIAEESLPVKLVCALPGLTTGYGPSHQATDDLAIFRAMPNLAIVDPCDATELAQAVPAIAAHPGPVYMRLPRGRVPDVLGGTGHRFELGRARRLRDGADVLFVSTGLMTMRALDASEALGARGVDCAVLHVATVKPLDVEAIVAEASRGSRLVVVAENHSVVGGLGEAVAATLVRAGVATAFRQVALPDEFLDAGALPTLHEQYGLSVGAVVVRVERWIGGDESP